MSFKLINHTGGRLNDDRNGDPFNGSKQRFDRWIECFKEKLRGSCTNRRTPTANPWDVPLEPLTKCKVESNIRLLQRGKPVGDDKSPAVLFEFDGCLIE